MESKEITIRALTDRVDAELADVIRELRGLEQEGYVHFYGGGLGAKTKVRWG